MKVVFIGHSLAGDVKENCAKVMAIVKELHSEHIYPVAPYMVMLNYLDDDIREERDMGVRSGLEYFNRKFIDELWLYGDNVSSGMILEIKKCIKVGIPVIGKTRQTRKYISFNWYDLWEEVNK